MGRFNVEEFPTLDSKVDLGNALLNVAGILKPLTIIIKNKLEAM